MDGYKSLLKSRKVLLALLAVANTLAAHAVPSIPDDVTKAINEFLLVVIVAITAEDVAAKFHQGTA